MPAGDSFETRLRIADTGDEPESLRGGQSNSLSVRRPRLAPIKMQRLVNELLAANVARFARQRIHVEVDVPADETILADADLLSRAVSQLVLNAAEAMPTGGTVVVTTYQGHGHYEIEVADSGSGLGDDARRRAFEPRYTTKPGSAGMGLALVQRIATAHGGNVAAMNCPEGGAAFTLRLPNRPQQAAA